MPGYGTECVQMLAEPQDMLCAFVGMENAVCGADGIDPKRSS